jgi:hypothetical protein
VCALAGSELSAENDKVTYAAKHGVVGEELDPEPGEVSLEPATAQLSPPCFEGAVAELGDRRERTTTRRFAINERYSDAGPESRATLTSADTTIVSMTTTASERSALTDQRVPAGRLSTLRQRGP